MFFAALISLSWIVPHSGQDHSLIFNGNLSMTKPQFPQRLLDGKKRSIFTSSRPYHWHLYFGGLWQWLLPPFRFFLKRGYLARFAQKFVKATWRCLRVCWRGTQLTSTSHFIMFNLKNLQHKYSWQFFEASKLKKLLRFLSADEKGFPQAFIRHVPPLRHRAQQLRCFKSPLSVAGVSTEV